MDQSNRTWEAEELDGRPHVRKEVAESAEFRSWRSQLSTFEVDSEKLYLPWGDTPMDEDQITYHWARSRGLID